MLTHALRTTLKFAVPCGTAAILALTLATGCNKKADDTANYKSAINSYYNAHPACLFPQPIRFPVQKTTSDTDDTRPYDALVDQGLLVRTNAEKKVMIIASKQVNNYDLSPSGRSDWTADPSQPGYGNFCYGHRSVSSIDASTPTNSNPGATTTVSYHYTVSDAPGWASAPETKTAFPTLAADLSGPQSASANLTDTSNGWKMNTPPDSPSGGRTPATSSDGKIVQ